MKKSLKQIFCLFITSFSLTLQAQDIPQLPLDGQVRYGKLENGLTYYIRHNEQPKERADFYIAQRVGSILEEENQRGLAHFLEHMAFNGTKNFPGKKMLSYLEENGVKFGTNVNAYTSIDETVYNLSNVPTQKQALVDSCLLILHDWSGFISLEEHEIDEERAVIHEEWRTRSNPFLRMYENEVLPILYPNNRYAYRMPIGLMEVVDNFPYQALRDYYHTWYRPDLQGIVIVGDIDVDNVEKQIKEMWKDIPLKADRKEREYFTIADNQEPLVAVATDKEAPRNVLSIMYKHDVLPAELKNSQYGMIMSAVNYMITSMLNTRYYELTQKSDAPYLNASSSYGTYLVSQTKDAFSLDLAFKEGEWEKGLDALMTILNSAKEYGFTPSEFERAKAEYLSIYENAYNEKDKVKNEQYVKEYLGHFLHNDFAPGVDFEYHHYSMIIPQLPLNQINEILKKYITSSNVAIVMMGTEKEGVKFPTKEELLNAFNKANTIPVEAYKDNTVNKPLMAKMPKAGKVKKEVKGTFNTTEWILSNGAKVIFKPTDFKKDQIALTVTSPGGTSLLPQSDFYNAKIIDAAVALGGVGNFSDTDLTKMLAGKMVSVTPYIGGVSEGVQANCAPKDFETMMQLTYLYFTAPRADKDAYEAWKKRTINSLESSASTPQVVFNDSLTATLYGHNLSKRRLQPSDFDKISYDRIVEIQKERFANASDFTFIFVGNINLDEAKPIIEKYIASLPSKGKKEKFLYKEPEVVKGEIKNQFTCPMQTPKTSVYNILSGKTNYSLLSNLKMTILKQVMDIVYTETIREQEGGTYGVGVQGQIKVDPDGQYLFLYGFDTGEEKRERLSKRAYEEFALIAENGPKEEVFSKVVGYLNKKYAEDIMENNYWMGVLCLKERFNKDLNTSYQEILNSITPEMIKDFAKEIINSGNRIQVICTGVKSN